ncbi:hypothetical protein M1307_03820 [Patescibacteria group bacterium]|nr:hypothetical protein [Patescibacteria group bacterium]
MPEGQEIPVHPRKKRYRSFVDTLEERSHLAALAQRKNGKEVPQKDSDRATEESDSDTKDKENEESAIDIRLGAIEAELANLRSPESRKAYQKKVKEYKQHPVVKLEVKKEEKRRQEDSKSVLSSRRPLSTPKIAPILT